MHVFEILFRNCAFFAIININIYIGMRDGVCGLRFVETGIPRDVNSQLGKYQRVRGSYNCAI